MARFSSVFLSFFLLLSLPWSCSPESQREEPSIQPSIIPEDSTELYSNLTDDGAALNKPCSDPVECKPGIILPVWKPVNPGLTEQIVRAIIYFVSLMYMFLGVSIIADRFMASIEVITSQEKEVTITMPNGETSVATVRIWNETVSNLTLMALGSSAPEILLSVIEVCGHGFESGELGPGTIVGSAAFNMFVIIGICVWVIPDGEVRKIKHLRVFFITAFWSIFAYIWLYLILSVISPGVVEVWEALVTLCYFPVCVILAWIADRRLLFYKYMSKRYRADKRTGVVVETEGEMTPKGMEMMMDGKFPLRAGAIGIGTQEHYQDGTGNTTGTMATLPNSNSTTVYMDGAKDLDESRKEVIRILKDLKQKYPDKELDQLVELANYYALLHQQKSRAFYRVQATRMMIGAGNVLKKHAADQSRRAVVVGGEEALEEDDLAVCSRISFESPHSQCMENCGSIMIPVVCRGGLGESTFYVDYCTEDGTANAGSDYEYCEGTLVFKPGETRKDIKCVFQSTVDKLIKKTNLALVIGTHSWREQFVEAVTVSAGDGDEDDEEGREERPPSCSDYVMHFVTVFWKVLFAFVPPTEYWNGWACFLVSITVIGLLTAVIGDLASHFGCTVGLRDTVTAVVFVALGTSIPDTFASKVAANQDQYADASIGNVTGSNAVNVFLGIGVAWSVAAVYWAVQGKRFYVDPGSLAFSVTLFTIFAFICMAVLLFRRRPSIGGELGGPRVSRLLTTLLFLGLWFLYILFSSLEAYCHIEGF
ncbi:sodium/calcium exchanger 2b [Danio aesculapii]|uniref:sodium/calcium exchanger 2b n=1 Tax=Danio aesculapii TaxID=1142201 RepID=UPI0024C0CD3D|nr:sodium/calcium exchanger 2b [Danio aesculapii]